MALALEIVNKAGDTIKIASDDTFLSLSITPKSGKEIVAPIDQDISNKLIQTLTLFIQARLLMGK